MNMCLCIISNHDITRNHAVLSYASCPTNMKFFFSNIFIETENTIKIRILLVKTDKGIILFS